MRIICEFTLEEINALQEAVEAYGQDQWKEDRSDDKWPNLNDKLQKISEDNS